MKFNSQIGFEKRNIFAMVSTCRDLKLRCHMGPNI